MGRMAADAWAEVKSIALLAPLKEAMLEDGSCRTPIAGMAVRGADDTMDFRGLVAAVDGSQMFETSASGAMTEEDAVRMGRDAGERLKAEAGQEFFDLLATQCDEFNPNAAPIYNQ